jgi:hypothetical protein
VFKDLLDGVCDFSSDTVTWNQGDLCDIEISVRLCGDDADRYSRYKHLRTWSEATYECRN